MPWAIKILLFISSDIQVFKDSWTTLFFLQQLNEIFYTKVLRFLEYSRIILILSWVMPVWFILILDIKHDNVHIFGHFNWTSGIFPFNVVVKPPIPVLIWPFLVSLGTVFIPHEIIPILMKMHSHRTRFPYHYFLLKYILFFFRKECNIYLPFWRMYSSPY